MITRKTDFRLRRPDRPGNMYRAGPKGLIYVRFRLEGREHRLATGRTEEAAAREVAWQRFLELSGRGEADVGARARRVRGCPTVGEVCGVYRAKIRGRSSIGELAVRRAVSSLRQVVELGLRGRAPDGVRLDELTEGVVLEWRRARRKAAGVPEDGDVRHNGSLNSALANARSVFSKQALFLYADEGLVMPDLSRFLGVSRLREMRTYWTPIAPEVMAAMDERALAELRLMEPRAWVAYEMARWCGLRQSEILACRWDWLEGMDGPGDVVQVAVIHRAATEARPGFVPKVRDRRVPVTAQRVAAWRTAVGYGEPDGLVIPGRTETERRDVVARVACAWIAEFLPDRKKRLHELRKQAACDVATREKSIAEAARFLGDTIAVAERYYAHLLNPLAPL